MCSGSMRRIRILLRVSRKVRVGSFRSSKLCGVTNMKIVCLNPAWSTFIGCHLTRHIKEDILAAGEWENPDEIEVAHDPYTCLPRIWGVLKKKA